MRFTLILCILLAALLVSTNNAQSHNIIWGTRTFRDTHLRRVIITEKSRFLRVVTKDYVFEQKYVRPRLITQIVVTDQIKDGTGGYAQLMAGGPHSTFARIHFKSQRNRGFNFIVDFYGI